MGELLVFLVGGEVEDGDAVVDLEAEGVDEVVDKDDVFEGSVGYYAKIFDETSWVKGEVTISCLHALGSRKYPVDDFLVFVEVLDDGFCVVKSTGSKNIYCIVLIHPF